MTLGPALAMLDIADIPHGLLALDALAKEALVGVAMRGTVQPGRYLILFGGEVEAVQRSHRKATTAVRSALVDDVLLPFAEDRILPAMRKATIQWPAQGDTLGIVQNGTPPSLLRAIDAALKGAYVDLIQLRIAAGLGGKAFALLWGETHDVEAALEIAEDVIQTQGRPKDYSAAIVRNADPEVIAAFEEGTTFFQEWRG